MPRGARGRGDRGAVGGGGQRGEDVETSSFCEKEDLPGESGLGSAYVPSDFFLRGAV